jgi:putative transposase
MYYGPEYIGAAIQNWAAESGIKLEYIQPGNPQQNAYVERFNRSAPLQKGRITQWLSGI